MGKGIDFLRLTLSLLLASQCLPTLSGQSIKAQNGVVTMELWCVAKNNAEDSALQSALDWACGLGGADCGPIQKGGPCYDASDVQSMASFAFNNYYLKNGMTDDSCNFDNTAALTSLNPSNFFSLITLKIHTNLPNGFLFGSSLSFSFFSCKL